jgi:predicted AAA+ superfamily ATPase
VHLLRPWHENLRKRQVKTAKVYIADPGLLHALLGVGSLDDLLVHPRMCWPMAEKVRAVSAHRLLEKIAPLT